MNDRVSRMRAYLAENADKFDGFFVTKPENRAYLSGFTGSFGYLLITLQETIVFTDGRYVEQASKQSSGWTIVRLQRPFEQAVIGELKRLDVRRMAFEAEHLTYSDYIYWTKALENTSWMPTQGVISTFRWRKDPTEIELIRKAVAIADSAFEDLLGILKPDMTEREAASELEFAMRKHGADAIAFDTIVASGWRGALPHGRASDKKIEAGDLVTFDFGARYESYNSDITRTVVMGQPTERQREVYRMVLESQLAGCEMVRPGITCSAVDAVSRQYFEKAGVIDYFLHSLGHSLGREVHEYPFLTPSDLTPLEPGMVVTVEPGLYISEWGGVRIEDDLLVTESGAEILPRSSKELIVL